MSEEAQTDPGSGFHRLRSIDVTKYLEKKGAFSYLSWAHAVEMLLDADPEANWEYGETQTFGETMMVSCTVTAFGQARKMYLPVLSTNNKAIANPDAFAVNTAMMRCLVKAIALHGLGLGVYQGEDLADVDDKNTSKKPEPKKEPAKEERTNTQRGQSMLERIKTSKTEASLRAITEYKDYKPIMDALNKENQSLWIDIIAAVGEKQREFGDGLGDNLPPFPDTRMAG